MFGAFASHETARQPSQLTIDARRQNLESIFVSATPAAQKVGHISIDFSPHSSPAPNATPNRMGGYGNANHQGEFLERGQ